MPVIIMFRLMQVLLRAETGEMVDHLLQGEENNC